MRAIIIITILALHVGTSLVIPRRVRRMNFLQAVKATPDPERTTSIPPKVIADPKEKEDKPLTRAELIGLNNDPGRDGLVSFLGKHTVVGKNPSLQEALKASKNRKQTYEYNGITYDLLENTVIFSPNLNDVMFIKITASNGVTTWRTYPAAPSYHCIKSNGEKIFQLSGCVYKGLKKAEFLADGHYTGLID